MTDLESARHDLLFAAELSARYHRRRAAFLESTNNLLNLFTLAGGAGAFISLYGPGTTIAKVLAVVLTVIGIIRIVYSPQACAFRHKDWLARWLKIIRETKLSPTPTIEQIDDWTRRRYDIEAECVVEMRALQADCYNRTARQMNLAEVHNYRLWPWHRLLMQVVRFEHAFEGAPRAGKDRVNWFSRKTLPSPRDAA